VKRGLRKQLFRYELTPQRKWLLSQTRERIARQALHNADLQLCLLHFRELKLSPWLFETGSSIAHARRDQGILWSWALNVWATHLYYQSLSTREFDAGVLPLDVFETICELIETREEWQLANDLSDIYPNGVSRAELIATLRHLYVKRRERGRISAFVQLVSRKGTPDDDLRFVERLVRYCESIAFIDRAYADRLHRRRN